MYLLIGSSFDECCASISAAMHWRGLDCRLIDSTFGDRVRFSWRLDNETSVSQLILDNGEVLADDRIDGVLVRSVGWINPQGWQPDDLSYAQTEIQAAMLGWLHGLSCPVVGRMPAALWYRPQMPATYWQPLLVRCGLGAPEALVTNVESEARAFGERLAVGAVYAPFSSPDRYLLSTDDDWKGVAALAACSPVCLSEPHDAAQVVCLAGERVIWNGEPSREAARIATGLRRFAASTELNFVEFATADGPDGAYVVNVDPLPHFERFTVDARQEIVQSVIELLAGGRTVAGSNSQRQLNSSFAKEES